MVVSPEIAAGLDRALSDSLRLGVTTGAVKVMIHRLRKTFRAAVEAEIAQTVPATEDIDEELCYLIEVLS